MAVERVPVSSAYVDEYYPQVGGQNKQSPIELDEFYIWLRKMPEVAGVIGAVCNDLMGDGFEFRGSKAGVKSANEFVKRNHFNKKFYSALQDLTLLGDAYVGIRIVKENYINKILAENKDSFSKIFDDPDSVINKLKIRSPDVFFPREVFPLKSSTIKANFDEHGRVYEYVQKVKGNVKEISFSPDEVIHLSLNNVGNDVYGSSPFNSCLNDVATLWYAKDYAGTFFQNDGTPDKMFILEDTAPGSEEFEKFTKSIKKFRDAKNKHKSLVMTGKVEVKDINGFTKDLEFSNLIDKFTQRLRMAWNMPSSRLDEVGKSGTNKSAEAGYYKNINRIQMEIEETLNSELWARFGDVEMVFKKAYKRDESVEADIVAKLVGKPVLTQNEGREYLGHKADETKPEYDVIGDNFEQNPGGQMPDTKEGEEVGNQYRPAEKLDKSNKNLVLKSFEQFVSFVESDGRVFEKSNVLVDQYDDNYVFFFKNDGVVYECKMPLSEAKLVKDFDQKYLSNAVLVQSRPEEQLIVAKNLSDLVSVLNETNSKMDSVVNKFSDAFDKKSKDEIDRVNKFAEVLEKSNESVAFVVNGFSKFIENKSESDSKKVDKFIDAVNKTNDKINSITAEFSSVIKNKDSVESNNVKKIINDLNKTNKKLQSVANDIKLKKEEDVAKIGIIESDVSKRNGANGTIVVMSSFEEFKHIVEADNRTFTTAKVFVDETAAGFEFCFADTVATYSCFVAKSDIKDEKEFRLRFVNYSFKGKLK